MMLDRNVGPLIHWYSNICMARLTLNTFSISISAQREVVPYETNENKFVSYFVIKVTMGFSQHAHLTDATNVGILLHCYTYKCFNGLR